VAEVKLPAVSVVFQYFRNVLNELSGQKVMMEYELRKANYFSLMHD